MLRLILIIIAALTLFSGCSVSRPSYTPETIVSELTRILKEEYKIHVVSTLVGKTLWVYYPIDEDVIVEETKKPQEYTRLFDVKSVESEYANSLFRFNYDIAEIPETKESQKSKYNPKAFEKINSVLRTIRRLFFSLQKGGNEPAFYVIVIADIKTGIEMTNINYVNDLMKASYEMISWVEYRLRTVEDITFKPEAIGDTEGKYIYAYDMDMGKFLASQIRQRIRYSFLRPSMKKNSNIDKEVVKIVRQILQNYNFKDFLLVDLSNLQTGASLSFSRAALFEPIRK